MLVISLLIVGEIFFLNVEDNNPPSLLSVETEQGKKASPQLASPEGHSLEVSIACQREGLGVWHHPGRPSVPPLEPVGTEGQGSESERDQEVKARDQGENSGQGLSQKHRKDWKVWPQGCGAGGRSGGGKEKKGI